jgi:peptidoglycan/LPS O-acetylase OafA/YrhL
MGRSPSDGYRERREWAALETGRGEWMSATTVRNDQGTHAGERRRLADRLSRRTSSGRYMPEVDGVRFLAIGIVLFAHLFEVAGLSSGRLEIVPPFGSIIAASQDPRLLSSLHYGHVGVYLFFILSGFVLAMPFIRWRVMGGPPVATAAYFLRRVTRIEPPFVLITLILFLLSTAIHQGPTAAHVLATVAYSHQAVYGHLSPINGVFWSLEAEVQWYLVVPLLAVFLCRGTPRERLLSIAVASVGTLVLQFWLGSHVLSRIALLDNLQFFLMGWLLAEIHVARLRERPRDSALLDVVGLVCLPLLFVALHVHPPSGRVTIPILGTVVIAAALHGHVFKRWVSTKWIAIIGGMCYSIYLVHYPIFVIGGRSIHVHDLIHHYWLWLWYVALLLSVLLLSAAFFILVERPCMDPTWVRRLASREKSGLTHSSNR